MISSSKFQGTLKDNQAEGLSENLNQILTRQRLEETLGIAKAQKGVLWCILGNFVCFIIPRLFLIILPLNIYYIYKLAFGLKRNKPILWVIGMFIPILSLILLLILSQKATCAIRESGFKVGLMGAKVNEIKNYLRSQSSNIEEDKIGEKILMSARS